MVSTSIIANESTCPCPIAGCSAAGAAPASQLGDGRAVSRFRPGALGQAAGSRGPQGRRSGIAFMLEEPDRFEEVVMPPVRNALVLLVRQRMR